MSARDDDRLDDDAREMLAAMREATDLPPQMRARVWARLHESVEAPVVVAASPSWRRIAIAAVAIAAGIVLVTSLRGADEAAEHEPGARPQAAYGAEEGGAQGEATRRDGPSSSPPSPPATVDPAPATVDPAPAPAPMPTPRSAELAAPVAQESEPSSKPATDRARRRGADESSLADEIAIIEDIRAALLADDPKRALTHVRAHARRFPHGALAQEREALGAVASCTLGTEGARGEGEAFVAAHPTSPLVAKVRAACADLEPSEDEAP